MGYRRFQIGCVFFEYVLRLILLFVWKGDIPYYVTTCISIIVLNPPQFKFSPPSVGKERVKGFSPF